MYSEKHSASPFGHTDNGPRYIHACLAHTDPRNFYIDTNSTYRQALWRINIP